MESKKTNTPDIIHLNVGGKRFSTSRQTLLWPPHSFFASLLSGRIPSLKDETGAIFIDRDPDLFNVILNYLRTNDLNLNGVDISAIRHEAEYYGLVSLVRKLALCEDHFYGSCGDVLFHGYIPPPETQAESNESNFESSSNQSVSHTRSDSGSSGASSSSSHSSNAGRPMIVNDNLQRLRNSLGRDNNSNNEGSRSVSNSSTDSRQASQNSQGDSTQSNTLSRMGSSTDRKTPTQSRETDENLKVNLIRCHQNWLAAAYPNHVGLFRVKDQTGWKQVWLSPSYSQTSGVSRLAINAKIPLSTVSNAVNVPGGPAVPGGIPGVGNILAPGNVPLNMTSDWGSCLVALVSGTSIILWCIRVQDSSSTPKSTSREIGHFQLNHYHIEHLFFVGSQLVALSCTGRVGVWHSMTHNWQIQEVSPIHSYDVAGTEFLLLGCENGCIYFIDMQKFPLRIVDNDLLVTKLYRDPKQDPVTALSVYLTPKTPMSGGNWIEIAYGTLSGKVRIVVQHPETVGQCPQLFQTFTVHRSKVTKVVLSEKHLISVCTEMNHVRTWSVTRFRGMINTQPGSTPLASFHVISMEPSSSSPVGQCRSATNQQDLPSGSTNPTQSKVVDVQNSLYEQANNPGPFGEKDEQLLFIQKVLPDANQVFVRLAANGKRVCVIRSVDGCPVSCFTVHECDGSNRVVAHPRRYLFTGHADGSVQIWDLTTALEGMSTCEATHVEKNSGGPTPRELIKLMDSCDLTSSSRMTTPLSLSPSASTYWNNRPYANFNSQWSLSSAQQNSSAWNLPSQVKDNY